MRGSIKKLRKSNEEEMKGGISEFLQEYAQSDSARFHMPGHKGRDCPSLCARWDITEITGADNLLSPDGIIEAAQCEAAEAYGASHTFFITCGSTCGILAMLLSLNQGARVAITHDCHKSVISALVLSGHSFTVVEPKADVLTADDLQSALQYEQIDAVFLTRPDFFGRCSDIEEIAGICRRNGTLLLVDQAHGAHFAFSPRLPQCAAQSADMCVMSAHKTLNAPNQAAYLHIGADSRVDAGRVARALALVHTTSPSYPVLAALDEVWRGSGPIWEEHIDRVRGFRAHAPLLADFKGVGCDETRLVFDASLTGGTGFELNECLARAGIVMEMFDSRYCVAITSPCDASIWYDRLRGALSSFEPSGKVLTRLPKRVKMVRAMPLREAALSDSQALALEDAVGRIAASTAGPYPPGHAWILPGEIISAECVEALRECEKCGISVFGQPIRCVRE